MRHAMPLLARLRWYQTFMSAHLPCSTYTKLWGYFVGAVVVAQVLPHSTPSLDDDFFFRFDFIPSSSLVHILLIASTRAKPPCRQEYDQIDQSATHYP